MRKYVLTLLLIFLFSTAVQVLALSRTIKIDDEGATDGDILVYKDGKITRAGEIYSKDMLGVLQSQALLVDQTGEGQPVTTSGTAQVNVTSSAGPIEAGDLITSSQNPGKGQKATSGGYVLGKALAKLDGDSGKIPVEVRIENSQINTGQAVTQVFNTVDAIFKRNLESKESSFKFFQYLLAALVFLASVIFAFLAFSRSLPKAIEAIGRNPLAKRSIQVSLIVNAFLTILVTFGGIVAAIVILRL